MIVDSQVHLWRAESVDRPWPPGGAQRAHLKEPMTYGLMLALMDQAGVDRAIIVPPSWEGDRNDYGLKAAAEHPNRFAVMGRINPNDPTSRELIARWRDQPGMLGMRLTFMSDQATWLDSGVVDWFWPEAERARIPVMIHAPGKMRRLGFIAERYPELPIILDHMGLNYNMAKEGRSAEGISETIRLSALPNVSVKLSSAPTYSHLPYPFPDMTDHIKRLVDAFGATRCYWGTDFTHSPEKCSYLQRKTHFTDHLRFLTSAELDLVMGNALLTCLGWR